MKCMMFLLVLLAAGAIAGGGSIRLEAPVICETDAVLQYDDGTAYWLTWSGLYRGVWFDVTDFDPSGSGFAASYTEYWFYHSPAAPWDAASFYAELWNGGATGPVAQLNQISLIATHFAPVFANYSPVIETEANFWGLVNNSLSSGSWPTVFGDGSPNPTSHSFYSDDFIIWEPWIIDKDATACDYFIRAGGTIIGSGALEPGSWGSIKGLYR
jgi:hypothetical protein